MPVSSIMTQPTTGITDKAKNIDSAGFYWFKL